MKYKIVIDANAALISKASKVISDNGIAYFSKQLGENPNVADSLLNFADYVSYEQSMFTMMISNSGNTLTINGSLNNKKEGIDYILISAISFQFPFAIVSFEAHNESNFTLLKLEAYSGIILNLNKIVGKDSLAKKIVMHISNFNIYRESSIDIKIDKFKCSVKFVTRLKCLVSDSELEKYIISHNGNSCFEVLINKKEDVTVIVNIFESSEISFESYTEMCKDLRLI